MKTKLTGLALATAAATLLITGCTKGDDDEMAMEESSEAVMVKCAGINECKGHSQCATAESACAGQNACKGTGWIEVTEDECDEKNGDIL